MKASQNNLGGLNNYFPILIFIFNKDIEYINKIIMKKLQEYIVNGGLNEGLKDSFINIFKNLFSHGEVSTKNMVTIEVDPKVFGKLVRDKEYFSIKNNEYPKLIPSTMHLDDMWELYKCELGEDKYGNETTIFTYIGHADFEKDNHKIEVDKNYKELVENVINKYK